jgi:ATP-dependent exoDNAse (exonuclease V) alpha subunit
VVDETSMVDVVLMNSLLKAVADHTAVLHHTPFWHEVVHAA